MKSNIYKIMCVAVAATTLSSCLDTVILPDDITVGEDFWKKKSDVALMVNAAYQGMTTESVLERLIVWGDVRGDELVQSGSPEGTIPNALAEVIAASMQVTNRYTSWADFYTVINRCNIVLKKAGEVLSEDPNYTQGDYLTDCSQMLALRSLCYFYLVRNFRDVPYVDEAFMSSSDSRTFVQSSPANVLQKCIESLEEAAANAINSRSYSQDDWRRVGWFTQDGIHALLADIYLWRASVTHSMADYQQAVKYCDLVIDSKKDQHVVGINGTQAQEYPLATAVLSYGDLFVTQNAEESLFELQVRANPALCKYFYKFEKNTSTEGYLKASRLFIKGDDGSTVTSATNEKVFPANDVRYYNDIYQPEAETADNFDVRKMISQSLVGLNWQKRETSRAYADLDQNYIVYRLTDVMLMKAEALVQLVDTTGVGALTGTELTDKQTAIDNGLREAFNLIQAVNTRSLLKDNLKDSLKWSDVKTMKRNGKSGMEVLVLEERLRELCFEGKRWYDLLRYNYRHVTGVNYNDILGNMGLESLTANYDEMLNLATRANTKTSSGMKAKLRNEAYLYLPIPNSDQVLSGLIQNPAYGSTNEYERK